jgi:hypothetical protein
MNFAKSFATRFVSKSWKPLCATIGGIALFKGNAARCEDYSDISEQSNDDLFYARTLHQLPDFGETSGRNYGKYVTKIATFRKVPKTKFTKKDIVSELNARYCASELEVMSICDVDGTNCVNDAHGKAWQVGKIVKEPNFTPHLARNPFGSYNAAGLHCMIQMDCTMQRDCMCIGIGGLLNVTSNFRWETEQLAFNRNTMILED